MRSFLACSILACVLLAGCTTREIIRESVTTVTVTTTVTATVAAQASREHGSEAPTLTINRNENSDRLDIIGTDPGLNWAQFKITNDGGATAATTGLRFLINGAPAAATGTANAENAQTIAGAATDAIAGATFIGLCASGAAGSNVTVKIMHTETNTQVFETTFATIAVCA